MECKEVRDQFLENLNFPYIFCNLICRITENVCEVKCARVTFVVLWQNRFKRICEVLIFKTTITYMITFARSRHINCPHYIALDKKLKLFQHIARG